MKIRFSLFILLFFSAGSVSGQQEDSAAITSAEQSFQYIASVLQEFRSTGRVAPELGLDGANYQPFIDALQTAYVNFTNGFAGDSPMCQFYLDPENSRMTIEERAELAFSFLGDLQSRIQRYVRTDEIFQNTVRREFGGAALIKINQLKQNAVNNQRLPTTSFDEAARINFADAMCI